MGMGAGPLPTLIGINPWAGLAVPARGWLPVGRIAYGGGSSIGPPRGFPGRERAAPQATTPESRCGARALRKGAPAWKKSWPA